MRTKDQCDWVMIQNPAKAIAATIYIRPTSYERTLTRSRDYINMGICEVGNLMLR